MRPVNVRLSATSPVIVHAPHTSVVIPEPVRAELLIDETQLEEELLVMTDAGVAELVEHLLELPEATRPTVVTATMSRLVFDPERFVEGDTMEAVGMGLVYTRRADGSPLRGALSACRMAWYRDQHRTYTQTLEQVVSEVIERFGTAVIVDLHSYPRDPLGYEDPTRQRPGVCLGTDSFHTPDWLRETAETRLAGRFEVGVNTPFTGAYVPGRFYGSDTRVHSAMLECRRDMLSNPEGLRDASAVVEDVVRAASSCVADDEGGLGHV